MTVKYAQKVREAAIELGGFTIGDLAERVGIYTYKDRERFLVTIRYFKKIKEIILLGSGLYSYQGRQGPLTKAAKMWRAMRIKEYFTRRDIMKLSGASYAYVLNYFSFLSNQGFIIRVSSKGFKDALYRISDFDNVPLEHPKCQAKRVKH